ncbi:hypothetical protein [Aureispira anguillae]|uniref:Uncharacterized protein n=1 Tax=Aureispira anguillae TaxID=2864201 RepID=A0A915YFB4_9BACT|nr:hypothetical protein [Aureispira anguillae]BDS11985.1 hypothetical protein AsAng_0027000 [Aureispira anguillae]
MMKYNILLLCLLITIVELQAGGPWTKKKGEGYAQFAVYAIPPINRLSINAYRTKFLNRAVFDATAELYVEYGLLDQLTLSASLPLKFVATGQEVQTVNGTQMGAGSIGTPGRLLDAGTLVDLGNVRLAGKYNFLKKKIVLSAHAAIAAPTALQAYNPQTALRTAYPCWGFQPSLSIGYSKEKIYTYLETGMNFRTHNYSHQWVANFEFGWRLGKRTYLALALDAALCLPGGVDVPNSTEEVQTGLYVNNQNFVALTIKAIVPVSDQIGLNLSLSGGLWANNVQQGPNIGVGVYYKWKKKEQSIKQ